MKMFCPGCNKDELESYVDKYGRNGVRCRACHWNKIFFVKKEKVSQNKKGGK